MRITTVIISIVIIIATATLVNAGTFSGQWSKTIYTCDGLATTAREIVKYQVDIPEGADLGDVIHVMNSTIGITALQGRFANLLEFQALINKGLRDTQYRDFKIVDVYVDER